MRATIIRFIFLLLLFGSAPFASATPASHVLFSSETDVIRVLGASGLGNGPKSINPKVSVLSPPPFQTLAAVVISGRALTQADVGKTFMADADSPGFLEVAEYLTDGQMNWAAVPKGITFDDRSECYLLHDDITCGAGIDFQGFVIDRMTYTLKDFYSVSPGRDPNGTGFWTDTYLGYRFTIEGHAIPEPTALTLLCLGSVCLLRRR